MNRNEFKAIAEQALEQLTQSAEKETGRILPRKYCFSWLSNRGYEAEDDVAEFLTQHGFVDETHIWPCWDLFIERLLPDGRLWILGYRAGFQPCAHGDHFTYGDLGHGAGHVGPFKLGNQHLVEQLLRSEPADFQKIKLADRRLFNKPHLAFYGSIFAVMDRLSDCFERLSKGENQIRLDQENFIIPINGIQLSLLRVEPNDPFIGLQKINDNPSKYQWNLDAERWDDLVALLKPFLISPKPCHQFLNEGGRDPVQIFVSKGESHSDKSSIFTPD